GAGVDQDEALIGDRREMTVREQEHEVVSSQVGRVQHLLAGSQQAFHLRVEEFLGRRHRPPASPVIGTKRTAAVGSSSNPVAVRVMTRSSWMAPSAPTGTTRRPPTFSCFFKGSGTSGGAAVTMTASNGASDGQPR